MIITAPNKINIGVHKVVIFLAGSIEHGRAIPWQDGIAELLSNDGHIVLNPRRPEWDASWEQRYSNIQFRDQIIWEQTGIRIADYVLFYFDPKTQSPITLLEFGECIAARKKCFVFCSPEYWRYGNIEVMCHLHKVPLIDNTGFDKLTDAERDRAIYEILCGDSV